MERPFAFLTLRAYFIIIFLVLSLAVILVSGIKHFPTSLSDGSIRFSIRSTAGIPFFAEVSVGQSMPSHLLAIKRARRTNEKIFLLFRKACGKCFPSVGFLVCLSRRFTSSGCWKTLSWRWAYNLERQENICAAIGARQVIGHAARPSLYSGSACLEEQGTCWFPHILFLRRLSPFILFSGGRLD